ncbi:uncharacterized protein LOC119936645 [Tachyglossus aculeatus]|uniref:uncharacterized protein LOC119936645 n=1 Tax=Tachyglossus aculeatus TaxID=9261 RepID=UPI0018F5DB05|nr:uncharacterized protein LOC119936645 [Tachyglossus aculeatus]
MAGSPGCRVGSFWEEVAVAVAALGLESLRSAGTDARRPPSPPVRGDRSQNLVGGEGSVRTWDVPGKWSHPANRAASLIARPAQPKASPAGLSLGRAGLAVRLAARFAGRLHRPGSSRVRAEPSPPASLRLPSTGPPALRPFGHRHRFPDRAVPPPGVPAMGWPLAMLLWALGFQGLPPFSLGAPQPAAPAGPAGPASEDRSRLCPNPGNRDQGVISITPIKWGSNVAQMLTNLFHEPDREGSPPEDTNDPRSYG